MPVEPEAKSRFAGSNPAPGTRRKKLRRDTAEAFLFLEKDNLNAKRR
jgi:hypothetical protein